MIGLDTNVLVRYIVQDDAAQAKAATHLIEGRCTAADPGFIGVIVLCEIAWVLQRGYRYDCATLAAVLRTMLTAVELHIEESETVWRALRAFESGKADFADYLIGAHNSGRHVHPTFTFDRRAAASPEFALVP